MKKNFIYTLLMLLGMVVSATSCSVDEGTTPGSDNTPVATVYTYTAKPPYDATADCVLRIATNSPTEAVYYLAESTESFKSLTANGENAAIEEVINKGKKVQASPAEPLDIVLENLAGDNTIAVVAVGGSSRTLSTATFSGVKWVDDVKGTFTFGYKDSEKLFGNKSVETVIQHRDDAPEKCRFKDVFGKGNSMTFTKTTTKTDDGGVCITIQPQNTPYKQDGNTITVRDFATFINDDAYKKDCVIYGDFKCKLHLAWSAKDSFDEKTYDTFTPSK